MDHSLNGWNIGHHAELDWTPWGGTTGSARAKIIAVADDHYLTLVEAEPGYAGNSHQHAHPALSSHEAGISSWEVKDTPGRRAPWQTWACHWIRASWQLQWFEVGTSDAARTDGTGRHHTLRAPRAPLMLDDGLGEL